MIAPINKSARETDPKTRTLHTARRAAASALLNTQSQIDRHSKPIARWQAWLFLAWTVVTTATYFAHMLGLID
jgi:nucleotidyltransferase/DNA polymerase involved in DNA repair